MVASCLHSHTIVLAAGEVSRQDAVTGVVAADMAEAPRHRHQVVLHISSLVPEDLHLRGVAQCQCRYNHRLAGLCRGGGWGAVYKVLKSIYLLIFV